MRTTFLTAGALAASMIALNAQAQLVQVAPGYVKAPFVRVYTYPDGSSFVRAPFVGVHSPGYYGYGSGPHYGHHRVHQGDGGWAADKPLGEMSWREVQHLIRDSASQLHTDVARMSDAEHLQQQLMLLDLIELTREPADGPPSETVREQITGVLAAYQEAERSPEWNGVVRLSSFQTLKAALREYARPIAERAERQASIAARQLNMALGRFDTAESWRKYLMLSTLVEVPNSELTAPSDEPGTTPAQETAAADELRNDATSPLVTDEQLAKIRDRFTAVAQNPQFHQISNLPAFAVARDRLSVYAAARTNKPASEELPPPEPVPAE